MGPFLGAVFKFGAALIFGAGAGASAVYALAVNVARLAILSLASRALAPKFDLTQVAQNKLITIRSTVAPQAFTYGRDMLSGPVIFANNQGTSPDSLHRLVALHGREIAAVNAFRIDDNDIVVGVDIPSHSATVSGGKFADVVDIVTRLGATDQAAIPALTSAFPSLWTSAHRGRGWSMLYTKMTPEGNSEAFESGIPQNLRVDCDGHFVYDPRLDDTQTGGSGDHRVNDPTTWEWSNNPALCWADHKIWDQVGYGEAPERVNWASVMVAADICEEQVDVPPAASPANTQNRYTCNFTFFADMERAQVKDIILQSMLGREVFAQGQWHVWAGANLTPDVTLTEANLAGGIQVQASAGYRDRYNRIHGTFVDPARDYTANPYPEQRDAAYEAADGAAIYRKLDLPACNNTYEAQRAAIITLRKSRNQRVVVFEGNWSCFRVLPGAVVALDCAELDWDGEIFFVTEWTLRQDQSGVTLTMVQELNVWADPDVGDYTTRTPTGDLVPPGPADVMLSNADIHNVRINGTCSSGVRTNADGNLEYMTADGSWTRSGVPVGEWRRRGQAEWFIRVTVNSGTLDDGVEDTWLSSSTSPLASIEQTSVGVKNANVTLEISSDDLGTDIQATGIFDLEAEVIAHVFVEDFEFAGTTTAGVSLTSATFDPNGYITRETTDGGVETDVIDGSWWSDEPETDIGDDYEIRVASYDVTGNTIADTIAFSSSSGAVENWVAITVEREYQSRRQLAEDGTGSTTVVAQMEIRDVATETIQEQWEMTLIATIT